MHPAHLSTLITAAENSDLAKATPTAPTTYWYALLAMLLHGLEYALSRLATERDTAALLSNLENLSHSQASIRSF
jgi:hypothetical protein